jgi:hypothetical protein
MKVFIVALMAAWFLSGSKPTPALFLGEISDSQCAFNVHSRHSNHEEMIKTNTMGNTPEECVRTCVRRDGRYVLVDVVNKKIYQLDNQTEAGKFAGKGVRIDGIYDKAADLLRVAEIKLRE